jgi:hypothetical protein
MISRTQSDPGAEPKVEEHKMAKRLSLHATQFRRKLSDFQNDIDEACSKADAWLNRPREEMPDESVAWASGWVCGSGWVCFAADLLAWAEG